MTTKWEARERHPKGMARSAGVFLLALLGVCAACAAACGGASSHTSTPQGDSDAAGAAGISAAGARSGAPSSGRSSVDGGATGTVAGGGGGGGGVTVITSEPPACQTEQGEEGIVVDTFPYPTPAPRCEPLNQSGALDSGCPAEPHVKCGREDCLLGKNLEGCCRADGSCGLWDTGRFGTKKSLGCISRDPWVENTQWLGGERQSVSCSLK